MTDEMSTAPATFDRNLPTWSRCAYLVRTFKAGSDQMSDAIQVSVDHRDDYSAHIFYPYHLAEHIAVQWAFMRGIV